MVVTEVIYRFILLLLLWHIVTTRILAKLFMLDESHYWYTVIHFQVENSVSYSGISFLNGSSISWTRYCSFKDLLEPYLFFIFFSECTETVKGFFSAHGCHFLLCPVLYTVCFVCNPLTRHLSKKIDQQISWHFFYVWSNSAYSRAPSIRIFLKLSVNSKKNVRKLCGMLVLIFVSANIRIPFL